MAVIIASNHLSDEDFLTAFNSCELPLASFRHGDHLRLAWLYLHQKPFDEALKLIRDGIQRYAAHHNASHIFHETVTVAWIKLLATHREASFAEFIKGNEPRLNLGLLHQFWSSDALDSPAARHSWLPPDRAPLPN